MTGAITAEVQDRRGCFDRSVLAASVLHFIGRTYAGTPHAAKRLARDSDASVKSAKNWLQGLAAPSGDHLLCLLAAHPALEADVIGLVHLRRDLLARSAAAAARSRARLSRA